jgi:site-specific DNA-methyltransferase (adenine-specific)
MNPASIVHWQDNLPLLRTFTDNQFDLAVVDPEYGIGGKGAFSSSGVLGSRAMGTHDTSWDSKPPPPEYFEQLFRVSKHQIIWGGNYFDLPPTRCFLVWDKQQPWPNLSAAEYAWTSFSEPAKIKSLGTTRTGEVKIHATQKPIELYAWIYELFAKKYKINTVLDTHLGSGSNRIAAHLHRLNFTGIENNQAIYTEQERRFESYIRTGGSEIMRERGKKNKIQEIIDFG